MKGRIININKMPRNHNAILSNNSNYEISCMESYKKCIDNVEENPTVAELCIINSYQEWFTS